MYYCKKITTAPPELLCSFHIKQFAPFTIVDLNFGVTLVGTMYTAAHS